MNKNRYILEGILWITLWTLGVYINVQEAVNPPSDHYLTSEDLGLTPL